MWSSHVARKDAITNPEVAELCVVEQVLCVSIMHREQYGKVCVFASTLCTCNLNFFHVCGRCKM